MTSTLCSEENSHAASQGPALNYCPQCGALLRDKTAFGQQRRYCSACDQIVFREHKVAAALLVTNSRNHILLARRAWEPQQGLWSLPAGFVDYGESPAEAAARECKEETGLAVEIQGLVDVIAGREHARGADIVIVYRGRILGGDLVADDDAAEVGFFPLNDLPPLAFEATHRAVALWQEMDADQILETDL
jgi:8-oxo-dGTP diphosphatase